MWAASFELRPLERENLTCGAPDCDAEAQMSPTLKLTADSGDRWSASGHYVCFDETCAEWAKSQLWEARRLHLLDDARIQHRAEWLQYKQLSPTEACDWLIRNHRESGPVSNAVGPLDVMMVLRAAYGLHLGDLKMLVHDRCQALKRDAGEK